MLYVSRWMTSTNRFSLGEKKKRINYISSFWFCHILWNESWFYCSKMSAVRIVYIHFPFPSKQLVCINIIVNLNGRLDTQVPQKTKATQDGKCHHRLLKQMCFQSFILKADPCWGWSLWVIQSCSLRWRNFSDPSGAVAYDCRLPGINPWISWSYVSRSTCCWGFSSAIPTPGE